MNSTKLAILLSTFFAAAAMAQSPAPLETTNSPSIASRRDGRQRRTGYFH